MWSKLQKKCLICIRSIVKNAKSDWELIFELQAEYTLLFPVSERKWIGMSIAKGQLDKFMHNSKSKTTASQRLHLCTWHAIYLSSG